MTCQDLCCHIYGFCCFFYFAFLAKCPRGTYYEKDSCKNCPVGTYQDQEGSLQCKPCRPGTGTKRTRNIFYQNCQSLCPAGTFSVSGFIEITAGGCKNCPINTFSDKSGSKKCIKCPNGTATVGSGSNSELSCLCKFCSGFYIKVNGLY